jgi:hypothetical protein
MRPVPTTRCGALEVIPIWARSASFPSIQQLEQWSGDGTRETLDGEGVLRNRLSRCERIRTPT